MPNIDFSLTVDTYKTKFAYSLAPTDFEMLPKINNELRSSKCNLGIWNLDEYRHEGTRGDVNQFAVGQNFIRKYNMTMKFSKRKDGTDNVSLDVFLGKADHEKDNSTAISWSLATSVILLAYVGWFTVVKFRRVR